MVAAQAQTGRRYDRDHRQVSGDAQVILMMRWTMRLMAGLRILDVWRGIAYILLPIFTLTTLITLTTFTSAFAASSEAADIAEVQYDITVQIDPVARSIEGRSVITVNTPDELTLMLGRRFGVMHARVDGTSLGPAASMGKMRDRKST